MSKLDISQIKKEDLRQCDKCGEFFHKNGLSPHRSKCKGLGVTEKTAEKSAKTIIRKLRSNGKLNKLREKIDLTEAPAEITVKMAEISTAEVIPYKTSGTSFRIDENLLLEIDREIEYLSNLRHAIVTTRKQFYGS